MDTKAIKERAKELIDNLSTDQAKVILNLLECFNEKKNRKLPGEEGESMSQMRSEDIR